MIRTVVYPTATPGGDQRNAVAPDAPQETPKEDNYADKLVKYIPAEVIGFFVPTYALATQVSGHWAQWLVLGLCALGTVGYLIIRAPKDAPPRLYFYVLALLSFFAWAIGTSDALIDLLRFGDQNSAKLVGKLIVAAAVFLIPLTDSLLTKLLPPPSPGSAPVLNEPKPLMN